MCQSRHLTCLPGDWGPAYAPNVYQLGNVHVYSIFQTTHNSEHDAMGVADSQDNVLMNYGIKVKTAFLVREYMCAQPVLNFSQTLIYSIYKCHFQQRVN